MSDTASKDENDVSSLLGQSNAGDRAPVTIYADPNTHRLLVNGIGVTGPTGATGATGPSGASVADGVYTPVKSITVSGGTIIAIATA